MKKAIVMAGVLFALTMTAGCGSQNQDHAATVESQTQDTAGGSGTAAQSENTDQKQTDGDRTDTAEADVIEEALQDNENTEKSSKVLVAYYSATGNTKAAAETIADAANCLSCSRQRHILQKTWIIMIRKAVSAKNMRTRIFRM